MFRTVEPAGFGPVVARIIGHIKSVSYGNGIAHIALPCAGINDFGVFLVDGDGADRLAVFVEYGLERCACIGGFPDTSAGGSHV